MAIRISPREALLAFFSEAKEFSEDVDGNQEPGGFPQVFITYHIRVDAEELRQLCESCNIPVRFDETPLEALQRADKESYP